MHNSWQSEPYNKSKSTGLGILPFPINFQDLKNLQLLRY